MKKRMRTMLVAAAVAAGTVLGGGAAAMSASAHGWVTDPPSRQAYCAQGTTSFDCGGVKYEPQSVEAPKGSMQCSGGNPGFAILDDNSRPWPRKNVSSTTSITWKLTARHATDKWEYFVDGQLFKVVNDHGAQPPSEVTHTLNNLPEGNHTILARWTIADTANAFYNCIDVKVGSGGTVTPEPTPTVTPTQNPNPGGECTDNWSSTATYTGGNTVVHNGHTWRASWWTRGETPGTTGQWGVWKDLGACAA